MLLEENLNEKSLIEAVEELYKDRDRYIRAMKESRSLDSIDMIVELLEKVAK